MTAGSNVPDCADDLASLESLSPLQVRDIYNYHLPLKRNCVLSLICDIVIFIIAFWQFARLEQISILIFILVVFVCVVLGFEIHYYVQVFTNENQRISYDWHRKKEYNPVIFLFLRFVLILIIINMAIYTDNPFTAYDIVANISFLSWVFIIILIVLFIIMLLTTIKIVSIHRSQSVVTEEDYTTILKKDSQSFCPNPGLPNPPVGYLQQRPNGITIINSNANLIQTRRTDGK